MILKCVQHASNKIEYIFAIENFIEMEYWKKIEKLEKRVSFAFKWLQTKLNPVKWMFIVNEWAEKLGYNIGYFFSDTF